MSLIDDIKKHEGFSPVVYKCTAGYDTIGYGKRIKYLKVTEEQAIEWSQKNNEQYIVIEPKERKIKPKNYSSNFDMNRKEPWTH